MNLLQTVQQNLGYPSLQKIDLSTDKMVDDDSTANEDKFSQAAIPAVLTALYKYVQTDAGAIILIEGNEKTKWITKIFDDSSKEAIQIISSYSNQSSENPIEKMELIASEAVKIAKAQLPSAATLLEVKQFFKSQINDILPYLLPTLKMGEILHDNTLDDDTNKMGGPISSLMHNLANVFTNPTTNEEIEKKKAE